MLDSASTYLLLTIVHSCNLLFNTATLDGRGEELFLVMVPWGQRNKTFKLQFYLCDLSVFVLGGMHFGQLEAIFMDCRPCLCCHLMWI